MTSLILTICAFLSVFLTGYTAISVFNKHGARLGVLFIDAAAITVILTHALGVW